MNYEGNDRFKLKPMMSDDEIAIIDRLIERIRPEMCLEWGSGGSTVYFPKAHDCIKLWDSVEHNGHYEEFLRPHLDPKVCLHWIQDDMDKYVNCLSAYEYDFILIDGMERGRCLEIASEMVSDAGCILLHDADRGEYQGFIKNCKLKKRRLSRGEKLQRDGGCAHRGLIRFMR